MRTFSYIIIIILAASLVAGFFIVGSPKEERLRRFDEQRVQNLQNLQEEIISFWMNKGKLPANLSDLKNDITGFYPPIDPENGSQYVYEIVGSEKFKLCATFNLPSLSQEERLGFPQNVKIAQPYPMGNYYNQNWNHGMGYVCFERTIDKDIYKPGSTDKPLR